MDFENQEDRIGSQCVKCGQIRVNGNWTGECRAQISSVGKVICPDCSPVPPEPKVKEK